MQNRFIGNLKHMLSAVIMFAVFCTAGAADLFNTDYM